MREFLNEIVKIVDDIEKMKLIEEVCLGYIIKKRPKRVCGECLLKMMCYRSILTV